MFPFLIVAPSIQYLIADLMSLLSHADASLGRGTKKYVPADTVAPNRIAETIVFTFFARKLELFI